MKCDACEFEKEMKENPLGIFNLYAHVHICNQPERSKREDFYQKLAKEYLDTKEHWETDASEKISIECFAGWLDRRCGALNTMETS